MTLADNAPLGNSLNILLLNPNSSTSMTNGMEEASITIDTYTAPAPSPMSINNDKDIETSTHVVLNDDSLTTALKASKYDAVLVACFSVHSLVNCLNIVPAVGIFEASILTSMSIVSASPEEKAQWGIVTTGEFWEKHLTDGVNNFLGLDSSPTATSSASSLFAGVFSTGLNAGDFHAISPEDVHLRLRDATKRLLRSGNITCVVMGCGGMAGLQDIIRSTAVEVYGNERANNVFIVDTIQAGILQLQQLLLSRLAFR